MKATTTTVTDPARYAAIKAFSMPGDTRAVVAETLQAAGLVVALCRRGGLLVQREGVRVRLTDERDAPVLTLKGVVELIGAAKECQFKLTTMPASPSREVAASL